MKTIASICLIAAVAAIGCSDGHPPSDNSNNGNVAECGDEAVAPDEECDDGGDSATCDSDCTRAICGDGYLNVAAGEVCDDRNTEPGDGCAADCGSDESCGNGIIDELSWEFCDDSGDSAACDADCTVASCGDGYLNTVAGEVCDEGQQNSDSQPDACRQDCRLPRCGDDAVDTGETCDNGPANSDTDPLACRTDCTFCGDGIVDSTYSEQCDDGNLDHKDDCLNTCRQAFCGDGVVWAGHEDCDGAAGTCSNAGYATPGTVPCLTGCTQADPSNCCADPTWSIDVAVDVLHANRTAALAVDATGYPAIAYFDRDDEAIRYARFDGSSWQIDTAELIPNAAAYGLEHLSMALDAAGNPHIAYYYTPTDDLKYVHHDGTGWLASTVDSSIYVGDNNSLAVDSAGRPHIAYGDRTNHGVRYAYFDGASWQIQNVIAQGPGASAASTSIAVDGSDLPHIAYRVYPAREARYSHFDGATWHHETVSLPGEQGASTSLALDDAGNPHIAYVDYYMFDTLKYTWFDGVQWHNQSAGSTSSDISGVALHRRCETPPSAGLG